VPERRGGSSSYDRTGRDLSLQIHDSSLAPLRERGHSAFLGNRKGCPYIFFKLPSFGGVPERRGGYFLLQDRSRPVPTNTQYLPRPLRERIGVRGNSASMGEKCFTPTNHNSPPNLGGVPRSGGVVLPYTTPQSFGQLPLKGSSQYFNFPS